MAALLLTASLPAQDKTPVKFGKISVEDFRTSPYDVDTAAAAVVLADVGYTQIVGNNKGGFSWEFTHHKRIHILKKSAFDLSTVEVELYKSGDMEEELENVKAYTYNLEGGKIDEVKLESKKAIFKTDLSKNWVSKKFTLPNVKEGSIIEFEYRIKSDFLQNLKEWSFQGSYPRLWSEYSVRIPQFIAYVFLMQGYLTPHIKEQKDGTDYFSVSFSQGASGSERSNFTAGVTTHRWVMKDVPELKEESFTSTLQNHVAKIEFQLSEFKDPLVYRKFMSSWPEVVKSMLGDEQFGASLDRNNGWLGDMLDPLIKAGGSRLEIAQRIYRYAQQNLVATARGGLYMKDNLKSVAKAKRGNVAEINLLLTAMLRYAGMQADPVILSTRSHGYTYPLYPLLDRFNYTVCRALIDDKEYFLDASDNQMGFGHLDPDCYNGHARVINQEATPLNLNADSLLEREVVSVLMINDANGGITGSLQRTPGYINSTYLRRRIKQNGLQTYLDDIKKGFSMEMEIKNPKLDSMELYEMPIKLEYEFHMDDPEEDLLYFSPMIASAWKENPFKAANRFYPVEMPYTIDETYLLRMDVPKGYEIEELPKQLRMKLNEHDESMFEFLISNSNGVISMRSRLKISRTYYMPDEYETLREFFAMVVSKQGEQIVFRKKAE